MSLTKETLCSLLELAAQDPGLNVELQAAASSAEVAAMLAKAGARKQIHVDETELAADLERLSATLESLQVLIGADTALQADVQAANTPAEVAAILAKAGARKQIEVDQAALTSYLEMLTSAQTSQALSDEQLENVAGGFFGDLLRTILRTF